ncbi:ferrochelatase [Oricola thermophila]|uniref:Ferrochelatase n=1 Tax=Oricola thermophila TaxID=2742145 RepID=A0A6N1VMF4_9HYPH|nr:ferrochelatase [Oricola thermophila]QKV20389.1 ferrochelatase [Oricola thermophila]
MNITTKIDRAEARATGPLPPDHPPVKARKIGVLLINLGTPDATDVKSMRRYLKEFLTDRRVIEWPRYVWYPILFGIVLRTRPAKVGKAYKTIWNEDRDESYLRTYTRSQAEKLGAALENHPDIVVDWAMRYGNPSIDSRMTALREQGCDRILAFPLYPQYSAATTATVNDKVFQSLMATRFMPAVRTVPSYHDEPIYIEALARSIEAHFEKLDFEPEKVIASYHGIPQSYFKRGDPYHCQCQKTSRLLEQRLGWEEGRLLTCFQSRFGPEEWLQPYTDKTIEQLARDGVKTIAVFNPGFVSDCLETLEEIAGEGADIFRENGGEKFTHIPCLNDSEEGMAVIEAMVRRELQGWI